MKDTTNENFTPPVEYASPSEIRAFQESKLADALRYLQEKSPFYRRMFQQHGIDPRRICRISDLRHIPATTKEDLQLYNDSFLCVPRNQIIDYITTSGTLSSPVTFAMSESDLNRLAYNEAISFTCAGATQTDVFQLMTTIDRRFMAGLAYFLGSRRLGAGIVRTGNGSAELQWDTIQRIRPTVAIAVPSFILRLVKYARENGIDWQQSSIRKLICIGENLRQQDFSLNLLGQTIREQWDVELYSTYASTEMATTFTECRYGCGGHHHPELIICELIDKDGNPIPEGEAGELTITTLGVEAMPLLRFRTGDLVRFHYEPCPCGRTTMRISPVIGRLNHMIKFKGTTLYPPAVFDVLDSTAWVETYQAVASTGPTGCDDLLVRISLRPESPPDPVKELKDRFRARIRVAPDVQICPSGELAAAIMPPASRKPVKFVDNRLKNTTE